MYWVILLNIFEAAASVAGFLYWSKIRNSYWRWFPVYLGIIFLTEISAEYFLFVEHNLAVNNNIYRFLSLPLEFLFLFWLFDKYFSEKGTTIKWPLLFAILYLAAFLADVFYISRMKLFFDSFSYTIGNMLLLILLLRFFMKFSNSDEILNYKSSIMFWVSLGLLLFYLGTLPFWGLHTTLYNEYPDIFNVYWYAQNLLNYLMYTLFIISFVWGKPR